MKTTLDQFARIITRYSIDQWSIEPTSSRFKLEIEFIDNSILTVKDYLFRNERKYAYHWQAADGLLLVRWDNAPHWRDVSTFPHHRHENASVFPSAEVNIKDVLDHILNRLQSGRDQKA